MVGLLDPEGTHAAAVRSVVDLRGLRVLEIGCGDGRLTGELAGEAASWHATDPKPESIVQARATLSTELARVTFAVAGGAEVEATEREFDLVFFSWSL